MPLVNTWDYVSIKYRGPEGEAIMLRQLIACLVALVFFVQSCTFPVFAASTNEQLEELRQNNALLQARIAALETKMALSNDEVKELLKELLGQQIANQRTTFGKDKAAAAIPPNQETAKKAFDVIEKIPDGSLGKDSANNDIKTALVECLAPLKDQLNQIDVNTLTIETGEKIANACNSEKARRILKDMKKNRDNLLGDYKNCRDAMTGTGKIFEEHLPIDPASISAEDLKNLKDNLSKFKSKVDTTAKGAIECADRLEKTVQDLKNMDGSAAAAASILNMAGTICMASGGNPYVCGGAFVLAFLMQLFGSGNGDGDGDGKPGNGGGGVADSDGNGLTSTPGGGRGTTPKPVTPVPDGLGNDFGNSIAGAVICRVEGGPKLRCNLKGNEAVVTVIDPATAVDDSEGSKTLFIDALRKNDGSKFGVCSGAPSAAVVSLAIFNEEGWINVSLVPGFGVDAPPFVRFVANPVYTPGLKELDFKGKLDKVCSQ